MAREEKKKKPLAAASKIRFDPLKNCHLQPLSMKDFAETTFPDKVNYILQYTSQRWILSENLFQQIALPKKVLSISDVKENLSLY